MIHPPLQTLPLPRSAPFYLRFPSYSVHLRLELEDNDAPVIHAMRVYGCGTTRRQNNLCENFNTTVSGKDPYLND